MKTDERVETDIEMLWNQVDSLEPGQLVAVSYASRGGNYPRSRRGTLDSVEPTVDGGVELRFYDSPRDRDVTVTVGQTVGDSVVKQSDPETDTVPVTIGPLLRLNAYPEYDDWDLAMNSDLHNAFLNRGFPSVRAVANVEWNSKRIDWLIKHGDAEHDGKPVRGFVGSEDPE